MSPAARADEAVADHPTPVVQKTVKRKWVSYIWDTFDKSPEERRLLFKLDSAILTFASLGMILVSLSIRRRLIDLFRNRLFHQVPRSDQHQQCICIGDERGSWAVRKSTQLHADLLDGWICDWRDSE